MSLSSFSIRHRITTIVLIFIILISGVYSYLHLPRESFPEVIIPNVLVTTPYEGVAPSDIESQITDQIEQKLTSISDVDEIRSYSSEGNSTIIVEFTSDIEIDDALQKVRDKVDEAKSDLPDDLEQDPIVDEINFAEFPIMTVIASGPMGLVRLKEYAEDLQDDIEAIQGVLEARITGGLEREIRITYHPERLASYNLGVTQLMQSVVSNNLNTPAGDMDIGQGNYLVKVPGEFDTPDEAAGLIVTPSRRHPVYLSDVAGMQDGYEEITTKARFNRSQAISIDVIKRAGENIIPIADQVKALVAQYQEAAPDGLKLGIVNDQSDDIRTMVSDLENNILTGLILVLVVVFVALGLRNAAIVASAIPLSMLITFFVLDLLGITLNMVVLFSLVLAVGMLVDNSIVIVENCYRHYMEGKGRIRACIDATHEVMWPVIASIATTVAAFFPMIFWPGITGEFMSYLPKAVIIALLASLFVALVVNPTLASIFLKRKGETGDPMRSHWLIRGYRVLLRSAIHHPVYTLCWAMAMLFLVMAAYGRLGQGIEFFPETDPPRAYVDVIMPKGANLERTDQVIRLVEEAAEPYAEVESLVTSVGAVNTGPDAFLSGGKASADKGRVMLEFIDVEDRAIPAMEVIEQLRDKLSRIYEADIEVEKEEGGPPTGAPVNIEISGESYAVLESLMHQIKERIRGIPGLVDMTDDYVVARPEVVVDVDKQRAALLGLDTNAVAQNIKAAIRGIEAGKYRDGNDEYDIIVQLPYERRQDLEALRNLMISRPSGGFVPLSSVAEIKLTAGLGTIVHIDRDRVISIEADVQNRLAADVMADVKMALADLQLPRGYQIAYRGESEDREEAETFLSEAFIGALMLIALILVTEFNSIYKPFIVLTSVILSTMGVFIGLMILQKPFGIIMTGIGVISLAGVVVNNAIVLLDYTQQLRDRGLSQIDSLMEAGTVRFRPVILTAITTILGLMPMAVGISYNFREGGWQYGTESTQWWGPMAVAVVFGLAIATLLTLVVVPAMVSAGDKVEALWLALKRKLGASSETLAEQEAPAATSSS